MLRRIENGLEIVCGQKLNAKTLGSKDAKRRNLTTETLRTQRGALKTFCEL